MQRFRERVGPRITVLWVLPDYYEDLPKPCMGGWGADRDRRRAERRGAALPGRGDDPRPRVPERARALARVDLERVGRVHAASAARTGCRSRAARARSGARRRTSAAAAARRCGSPATRRRPIRSAGSHRTTTRSSRPAIRRRRTSSPTGRCAGLVVVLGLLAYERVQGAAPDGAREGRAEARRDLDEQCARRSRWRPAPNASPRSSSSSAGPSMSTCAHGPSPAKLLEERRRGDRVAVRPPRGVAQVGDARTRAGAGSAGASATATRSRRPRCPRRRSRRASCRRCRRRRRRGRPSRPASRRSGSRGRRRASRPGAARTRARRRGSAGPRRPGSSPRP